ncbi:MAG: acyltransferase [Candidatus Levybacteria bacterium]|nr:acyltransferase [Candidatus Levybacteria bacterium]
MERKRFDEVDILRAFGIIAVILIHILTRSLTNPFNIFLWNNLQFFVISFVFASGFVLASIYENAFTSISNTFTWYKKRLIRLLVPFYIYLGVHLGPWTLFPNLFAGLGLSRDLSYIAKSALLIGGTNYNFLVILFVELTLLFPIFINFFKNKWFMTGYLLLSGFITLFFTFYGSPYSLYRFTMLAPWSLVLIFSIFISLKGKHDENGFMTNKRYFIFGLIFFLLYLGFYFLNMKFGKSLNFYDHKYPPDFYYLFFGLSLTCFSLLIGKLRFWQNAVLKQMYLYISKNSYAIFFIHFIILDLVLVLAKQNVILQNPVLQFVVIFFPSIFIVFVLNKIKIFKKLS